ncbi:MAG: alpha/beta hydrolase [Alphaproteobacteria bacterium]|nr:alpha/beta hydrolase [Alphaproteobacteria bacterium]
MVLNFIPVSDNRLAYQRQEGNKKFSGLIFLSGFASNMEGTKATYLSRRAQEKDVPFVRFDYRGCGQSEGDFENGTIGRWLEDSIEVIDKLTEGSQIVVGSSMGGWLGLLLAKARPERVKAFIGVAAAPDFTEELIWKHLTPSDKAALMRDKKFYEPGAPPHRNAPISLAFFEESRKHLILGKPFEMKCPVSLLQGFDDREVPWTHAVRIAEHIACDDLRLTLVKNGDHSLSSAPNLELLWQTIESFL